MTYNRKYLTWWRIVEEFCNEEVPYLIDEFENEHNCTLPENLSWRTSDCIREQIWAIREGLADDPS